MKKSILGALALSAILAVGCGQKLADTSPTASGTPAAAQTTAAEEPAFTLALSEAEALSFEPTSQKVDLRGDTKSSTLILGNYEFQLAPKSANSIPEVEEGQVRVHIGLKGGKDATFENPAPVGE